MSSSRIEKLIHYIVSVVPPEQLGAVKLAKILWFSDVEHYRLTGRSVTGSDSYRKFDQGPLHTDFYTSLDALKQRGCIAERQTETWSGFRREFLWLKKPDMSDFNGQELATVHSVIHELRQLTAKQASDMSHGEPWASASDGEHLPVYAAAVQFGEVSEEDLAWAESEFHAVRETA